MNPHQIIMKNKLQNQNKGGENATSSQNIYDESAENNDGASRGKDGSRVNKCSIKFILPKEKDV